MAAPIRSPWFLDGKAVGAYRGCMKHSDGEPPAANQEQGRPDFGTSGRIRASWFPKPVTIDHRRMTTSRAEAGTTAQIDRPPKTSTRIDSVRGTAGGRANSTTPGSLRARATRERDPAMQHGARPPLGIHRHEARWCEAWALANIVQSTLRSMNTRWRNAGEGRDRPPPRTHGASIVPHAASARPRHQRAAACGPQAGRLAGTSARSSPHDAARSG